jgi:Protein of unknown function (DUF1588)/Protein of unknown function (DUF1585)
MRLQSYAMVVLGVVATPACSSRYEVGFDPMEGGAAGQIGAGAQAGSAANAGATSSGAPSSGGSASGGTASGGFAVIGEGGATDTVVSARCGFEPDLPSIATAASASSAVVASRIDHFLDDTTAAATGALPAQPSAAWAADRALSILDAHLAAKTEAPGLVRFLTHWLAAPSGAAPLKAPHTWSMKLLDPNATLSTLLAAPTGEPHRLGILTDKEVLALRPAIPLRGTWMTTHLFCQAVPPPPANVPASDPNVAGVTRREKQENTVSAPTCQACHQLIDPPGDSLEHFDALGNYRELDGGQAVNSAASIAAPPLSFDGFEALAPQLAESCVVAQCFAQQLMADSNGEKLAFTAQETNHVANAFANSGFSIRELVKAIVTTPTFLR